MKHLPLIIASLLLLSSCQKFDLNWDEQTPLVSERLNDIFFVDENIGYIVGGDRYEQDHVLKTLDGGQSWTLLPDTLQKTLFASIFQDEQHGFASGLDAKILRTQDGGQSWQIIQLDMIPFWQPVHDLKALNDSVMLAVGGDGYALGHIMRSIDGGQTWAQTDSLPYELRALCVTDPQTAYACGYGNVFKTTNAGESWEYTSADGDFFSDIDFPTTNTGYIVGRAGSILKTTDAGDSWKYQRNGNNPFKARHRYNDVQFLNETVGYVVGDEGLLLKTTDGGKSWEKVSMRLEENLYAVWVFEEGRGIVVGENGSIAHFQE